MTFISQTEKTTENPLDVLGIEGYVSDAELRSRYTALVRRYPPEKNQQEFRRIRSAYEALRRPGDRARWWLRRLQSPPPALPAPKGRTNGPLGISPTWWLAEDPWAELNKRDFAADCRDPLSRVEQHELPFS